MLGIDVNYVSVFIAAVVYTIIGAVWYSPVLFGNSWTKLIGFSEKELKQAAQEGMGKTMFSFFVTALLTAYVLSMFVAISGTTQIDEALKLGFWTWLGFVATTKVTDVIFAKRPLKLYYIDAGYNLVGIIVMSIILTFVV